MIVIGAFVVDRRTVGQDQEAMGKARRYPKLRRGRGASGLWRVPLSSKNLAFPLSESGRIWTQIHRHIENGALRDADQLALRVLDLIMQAAQHIFARIAA